MSSGSDAAPAPKSYATDPALYIYTSLTAGSSHIVTATSRLETILRANRVPFKAIDLATDEKARMIWGRRAGKDESGRVRKLPGLVQMGMVLGDIVEIEDWNEYGELKQHVTMYYDEFTQPSIHQKPKDPPPKVKRVGPAGAPASVAAGAAAAAAAAASKASSSAPKPPPAPAPKTAGAPATTTLPVRSVAEEAAQKAKQLHLQSLRNKVAQARSAVAASEEKKAATEAAEKKTGDADKIKAPEKEAAAGKDKTEATPVPAAAASEKSLASVATDTPSSSNIGAGLQSPTSGAWKGDSAGSGDGAPLQTVQSPTTTRWKPTDVDAPATSFRGSQVRSASAEEIKALEQKETIKEESDEDDKDDDEDEESDEDEEDKEEADDDEEEDDEDDEDEDDDDESEEDDKAKIAKPDAKQKA